ncbi:sugar isomerase [Bacillus cereus]|nr:sugar isomerase [Bacillus cereus]PFC52041.1 sugar isomerase [Bacillus cereus]
MKYQTLFPSLKKSLFIFILSFSMLIFTLPTSTFAQSNENVISSANYYVSLTGSDLNPGTLDRPFATIQKAANVAKEGSTIYIRGGVYNPKVRVTHSGASGAPITFQNYQDEKVILDGSKVKLEDDGLFTIEDKNYIQVKELDPMHTKLAVVGDVNRSGSIVLAATPPLKALGVNKNVWFGI